MGVISFELVSQGRFAATTDILTLCSMSLLDGDSNDDLYFNPFAGSSQSSFSSAVKRTTENGGSIGTRPGFRRRGSESNATKRSRNCHNPLGDEDDASGGAHARAQTADAVFGSSSSTKFHPLQPPLNRKSGGGSSSASIADTRPRLKRLLSDLGPDPSGKVDSADEDETSARRSNAALKEKIVIVHEVRISLECVAAHLSMHVSVWRCCRLHRGTPSQALLSSMGFPWRISGRPIHFGRLTPSIYARYSTFPSTVRTKRKRSCFRSWR